MNKEYFIETINGFDIKNINEYWLRVKGSDDLNFELMQGFDDIEEDLGKLDELNNRIDKAIEYIENNCILSDEWTDLDFCNLIPTGKIVYKQLSKTKIKKLLDILRGKEVK